VSRDITTLRSPPPDGKIHDDCRRFHAETGECICLTVACAACEKRHAPFKRCPKPRQAQ
jgi:hypothetical protein